MDKWFGRVSLRPPGGGTEWEADPLKLRLATHKEKAEAAVSITYDGAPE